MMDGLTTGGALGDQFSEAVAANPNMWLGAFAVLLLLTLLLLWCWYHEACHNSEKMLAYPYHAAYTGGAGQRHLQVHSGGHLSWSDDVARAKAKTEATAVHGESFASTREPPAFWEPAMVLDESRSSAAKQMAMDSASASEDFRRDGPRYENLRSTEDKLADLLHE